MAGPEARGQEMTIFGEAEKQFSEHRKGEVRLLISPALQKSYDAWGNQDPEEILLGEKKIRGIVRERLGDLAPYLEQVWFAQDGDTTLNISKDERESTLAMVPVGDGKWRDSLTSELDNPHRTANLVIQAAVRKAMSQESLGWTELEIKDLDGKRPTKETIEKLGRLHVEAAEKEKIIAAADAAVRNHEDELTEDDRKQMKRAVETALFGMGSARKRTFTPRLTIFGEGTGPFV